jgi:hypothetical protein
MTKKNDLQKQLAAKQKEADAKQKELEKYNSEIEKIQQKISDEANKNKPKSIMDRVKTFADVLKISKPSKEELAIINYSGKSKRLKFASAIMRISLISEVLNEGHRFTMKDDEARWYPWFYLSSGFVFGNTRCDVSTANSASASALCLKSEELARYVGEQFTKEYKNAITLSV